MTQSWYRNVAGAIALLAAPACGVQDGPTAPAMLESARFSTQASETLVFYGWVGDRIVQIDPVAFTVSPFAQSPYNPIDGLAAGGDGNLLVTDLDPRSPPPYELHSIDLGTGAFTTVGPSGSFMALVLHDTHGLLAASGNVLQSIDAANGTAQTLGSLDLGGSGSGGISIMDMATTADGALYGIVWDPGDMTRNIPAQGSRLVRIDPAALTIADVAFLGAGFFGGVSEWGDALVVTTCDGFSNTAVSVDPATGAMQQVGTFSTSDMMCVQDLATAAGTRAEPPAPADVTPPVITFEGAAATYTVAETVAITCTATDAESGLATSTCADINRDAYTFDLGGTSITATATDNAGNTASATVSFTVIVTPASLADLTRRLVEHRGIANALAAKLDASAAAAARGNDQASDGSIAAYISQLRAQAGKHVTADTAALLERLALAL